MKAVAFELFATIVQGEQEATTSEVVLHEVCYLLASKKHYNLPASDIASYLSPLLQLPELKLRPGDRRIYLRALEIFVERPKLEFADSVILARCESPGIELATFDEELGRFPTITRWQPAS